MIAAPTEPAPQLTLPEGAGKVLEPEDVQVTSLIEDGEQVFQATIVGLPAAGIDVSPELAVKRLAALLGSFVKGHAWTIAEMQARFAEEGIMAGEAEAPEGALMSFSSALGLLKAGKRVKRIGWSEGTFVAYQPGYPDGIGINANTAKAMGKPEGTVVEFLPYLIIHAAESGNVDDRGGRLASVPWAPSMHALLADDWQVAP